MTLLLSSGGRQFASNLKNQKTVYGIAHQDFIQDLGTYKTADDLKNLGLINHLLSKSLKTMFYKNISKDVLL